MGSLAQECQLAVAVCDFTVLVIVFNTNHTLTFKLLIHNSSDISKHPLPTKAVQFVANPTGMGLIKINVSSIPTNLVTSASVTV